MSPPNPKRELLLGLLGGPAMQVILILSKGDEKSWTIPKALLVHYAGYFLRLRNFVEGETGKVTLESFEPEIFELFVEFIYFGRYTYRDELIDYNRIRDSARAWILGDYLDAIEFKNFAMKNLYDIYFPITGELPRSGAGPRAIDYYFAMTPICSQLREFFLDVLIVYWHNCDIIQYTTSNRTEWEDIWVDHSELTNDILFFTNQRKSDRESRRKVLKMYLEGIQSDDEPEQHAIAQSGSAPEQAQWGSHVESGEASRWGTTEAW